MPLLKPKSSAKKRPTFVRVDANGAFVVDMKELLRSGVMDRQLNAARRFYLRVHPSAKAKARDGSTSAPIKKRAS